MPTDFGPQLATFSKDDGLWLAEYPIKEIFNLFQNPVDWVRDKNKDNGDNSGSFNLLRNYVIHILPAVEGRAGNEGRVQIQGIHNTNVITIQPTKGSAQVFQDVVNRSTVEQVEGWPHPSVMQAAMGVASSQGDLSDGFFATVRLDEEKNPIKSYLHFEVFRPAQNASQTDNAAARAIRCGDLHLMALETDDFYAKNLQPVLEMASGTERLTFLEVRDNRLVKAEEVPSGTPSLATGIGTIPMTICATEGEDGNACEILLARYLAGDRELQAHPELVFFKPYASEPEV